MEAEKTNIIKETSFMDSTQERCRHLRQLQNNLFHELQQLKEGLNEEEREGVANPIETVNIIKSLQKTLQHVEVELEKCPPDV
jgi:hypothetical protein